MGRRDIVIALIIFALLGVFIYFRNQRIKEEESLKVPQTLSVEDKIEEVFRFEIPEDVEKAELKDVSGIDVTGIATRKFEDGKFTHMVLADLPEAPAGKFYQGWLVKGDNVFTTGRMRIAKGGYLLEFESNIDYSDYKEVLVTEEMTADNAPEKRILEGSF